GQVRRAAAAAQRRRTTNAVALQFRHSATWDSARRVISKASTAILTSSASRAVTRLRQARQMNLGLYAARKASISPGMVERGCASAPVSSTPWAGGGYSGATNWAEGP